MKPKRGPGSVEYQAEELCRFHVAMLMRDQPKRWPQLFDWRDANRPWCEIEQALGEP